MGPLDVITMRGLVGRTLGHYTVVEKIGEGGMGEVYRAHDERLDRDVALKVIRQDGAQPSDRIARFEREAKAVARLDHPHILAIHDFGAEDGVTYAVTELLEGQSLRHSIPASGLPWRKVVEMGAAIADGLAAAHGKAIVHRDLKPENIFVASDGRVKILDFGLARFTEPVEDDAETAALSPPGTVPGSVLGTMGYTSPEQLRGEAADARSDIFALGCLLYEMLSGRTAFLRNSPAETTAAILKEEPRGLSDAGLEVPAELERTIRRCLEKSPEARFQSASDLAFSLRSISTDQTVGGVETVEKARAKRTRWLPWSLAVAAVVVVATISVWFQRTRVPDEPAAAALPRIVVLPFENLGPADDAYFADGITEEITARLASVAGLQVISRTSAVQYADTNKSIKQMGQELGVDYVLEGSIRWSRGEGPHRIRITPQLIRVQDDSHLWAETYDRVINDVFDVQLEIAESVTDHLGVVLVGGEQGLVETQPTENLEAYQAYLRGRYWATRPHFTYENWKRRMQAFERAVELDPEFALAYAELARGHALARFYRHDLTAQGLDAADAAAATALELAPDNPRVRLDLGYYQLWAYRDIEKALAEFALAEAGLPHSSEVLHAQGDLLKIQGRWEEALDTYRRAFDLSPRDADLAGMVCEVLWVMRRYPEAADAADQEINLAPDAVWPYLHKVFNLWSWKGSAAGTRSVLEALPDTAGGWERWTWYQQETIDGRYGEALGRLESTSDGWISLKTWARPNTLLAAYAYEQLGKPEKAAAAYEAARRSLEDAVAASPEDPRFHSSLGIVYAKQGRSEEAIREGVRATELLSRSMDGFYYVTYVVDLAHIYTILGDNQHALEQLEYLLSNPSWISAPWLRMEPRWDRLRDDPRFEALLEKYETDP